MPDDETLRYGETPEPPKEKEKPYVPTWSASKRIYCVVAQTVQWPIGVKEVREPKAGFTRTALYRMEGQNSINQPPGRLIAQASHAISLVSINIARKWVKLLAEKKNGLERVTDDALFDALAQPITKIILEARDSFELLHTKALLDEREIPNYAFEDSNQIDYGNTQVSVTTAIATEPVSAEEVAGILDYLPLWSPKEYGGDRRRERERGH